MAGLTFGGYRSRVGYPHQRADSEWGFLLRQGAKVKIRRFVALSRTFHSCVGHQTDLREGFT